MPTGGRPLLPPVPAALQSDASSEKDQPRPAVTSATIPPSVLQRLGAISFSSGDWLILGLLIFFLFMTEETDYVMVGILAYLLLSD